MVSFCTALRWRMSLISPRHGGNCARIPYTFLCRVDRYSDQLSKVKKWCVDSLLRPERITDVSSVQGFPCLHKAMILRVI